MERLTKKVAFGHESEATREELITRLGEYEDLYESILADRANAIERMEKLQSEEKTDSVAYRQAVSDRLMFTVIINKLRELGKQK